eukprot:2077751-Rhodomonas_salina.1
MEICLCTTTSGPSSSRSASRRPASTWSTSSIRLSGCSGQVSSSVCPHPPRLPRYRDGELQTLAVHTPTDDLLRLP